MRRRLSILAFAAAFAALFFPRIAPAATVEVAAMGNSTFFPKTVNINVGDEIHWSNVSGNHNVKADDGSFRNAGPSTAQWDFTQRFDSPGTFGYHCEVHGAPGAGMFGTIIVAGGGGSPGSFRFNPATRSVPESAGTVSLTVQRIGGDDGAVSVEYETVDGTASHLTDYTQTNGILNWADNDDNDKTIVVPITNDTAIESDEQFQVRLQNPSGGATLGSPSTATVTIRDNDTPDPGQPGSIQFNSASKSVGEGSVNVSLTLTRTGGSSGAVSARVTTANGTATSGTDYQSVDEVVSWANGDASSKNVVVPIVGDTVEESAETFTATVGSPTGGATIGTPSTTTVTIDDDDLTCTPCVADDTTLCLAGGSGDPTRFRVRVNWTDFQGGTGAGHAVPFTNDSGFFYFFNPSNLELLAKMVNGCGTPFDAYWFFYAAASNVALDYQVLDTVACVQKTYHNDLGNFASDGDVAALATCASNPLTASAPTSEPLLAAGTPSTSGPAVATAATLAPAAAAGDGCTPCVADDTTLCLAGGSGDPHRFKVQVNWTDFQGGTGAGHAVPFTNDSGFFYFFNPSNLELLAKMVNGCGTPFDAYWFFYAAASNVELDYVVTDTTACTSKTYHNPLGNFASDGDVAALPTCASNPAAVAP